MVRADPPMAVSVRVKGKFKHYIMQPRTGPWVNQTNCQRWGANTVHMYCRPVDTAVRHEVLQYILFYEDDTRIFFLRFLIILCSKAIFKGKTEIHNLAYITHLLYKRLYLLWVNCTLLCNIFVFTNKEATPPQEISFWTCPNLTCKGGNFKQAMGAQMSTPANSSRLTSHPPPKKKSWQI
jgi:hypothetical protein